MQKLLIRDHSHYFFRIIWILSFLVHTIFSKNDKEFDGSSTWSDVLQLNGSNFESTLFRSGKNGMVKFYQSWCGHSVKMKPTWEQLAKLSNPSVFIANIDCGVEKDICRSYHITTYPTFRYYLDGVEHDYEDALSLEALREFVDTKLAVQCNPIVDKSACSEPALKYAEKWVKKSNLDGSLVILSEIERLEKMMLESDSKIKYESRRWARERRDILQIIMDQSQTGKQLHTETANYYEL